MSNKSIKIFIGVGHGGADPGAVAHVPDTNETIVEKQVNLLVAFALEAELKRHGFQVKLSRYGDEADRLADEIAECNAYSPDFAIEIHTNAGGGSGFEVYHPVTDDWDRYSRSIRMAQLMQKHVQRYQQVKPRDVKAGAKFGWLNKVHAPAVLCENFFVDGPNAAVYARQDALKQLAKAYAVAILEYYGMRYVEAQYTYKVNVIDYNYSIHTCKLQADMDDGHIHGDLRSILSMVDYGMYYNDRTRELTVFPELLFDESSFADGAITLDEIAAMGSLDEMEDDFYYDVGDDVLKVNCACAREDTLGCSVPEDDIPIVEQYFDFA